MASIGQLTTEAHYLLLVLLLQLVLSPLELKDGILDVSDLCELLLHCMVAVSKCNQLLLFGQHTLPFKIIPLQFVHVRIVRELFHLEFKLLNQVGQATRCAA